MAANDETPRPMAMTPRPGRPSYPAPARPLLSRRRLLRRAAPAAVALGGLVATGFALRPPPLRARAAAAPAVQGAASMRVFYSPAYALAAHSFETTRKARWVAESLDADPLPGLQVIEPTALTASEVAAVHDPAYVEAVRTGRPRDLAESQGFVWDPGLWTMVLASNGGAVEAARAALQDGIAGSLSSGLHHAERGRGKGFCTFNGLALSIQAARAAGAGRLLIVDLDAHCGGGTHSLVGTDSGVIQLDVAVSAFDTYTPAPWNTLDLVRAPTDYLPTIAARLDDLAARAESFDLCLYNAGMDPHEGCPVGGLAGLTTAIISERERLVFDWCRRQGLPLAFVLAGGYTGPTRDQRGLVDLHRLTLAAALAAPSPPPDRPRYRSARR